MADIPEKSEVWREDWCESLDLGGVPIITGIPKGEKTEKVSVSLWNRIRRMAEILRDNSPRFRTSSDVYRAALNIGLHILYHLNEKNVPTYGEAFFKYMLDARRRLMKSDILDMFTDLVNHALLAHDKQNITSQEVERMISEAMDIVPDDCKEQARKKMDQISRAKAEGVPIARVYENGTSVSRLQ
jgi:hypothetical protein